MSMPMDGPDADGLDGSWDDCSDLPDLSGIEVHHIEAAAGHSEPAPASRAAKLGSGARFKALKARWQPRARVTRARSQPISG